MQKRSTVEFVIVAMAAVVGVTLSAQSADPWIGTWKVNMEKSTFGPGAKPFTALTIRMESAAGGIKMTFDAMTPEGNPFHSEVVGAFDGQENAVKGAQNMTTAFKRIDDRTFQTMNKMDGKPTTTGRVVISPDGKLWTGTITGKSVEGETINNVIVAEKQ